ncbi:hypothetical protein DOK78_001445 [Enterococcus sp. DIV2402]|uniref:N-acetyltransferase domain-containing protein n=1 Tax=Candidatus Enterococcus lowellii TaxID=2230877 RepID=A0ABZ2SRM3_9ENTE|nr:GNAT family N-acetyltransferase [Enterococcus sp. DIV2402]MBO0464363.1 GNAT family N-acetyltransferase [Enterococcus sp. DIV2402]
MQETTKADAIYQLAHYAFQFNQSDAYKNRLNYIVEHSKHYGSYDGEQLASQIIATPLKVQFFNQVFDMAGVGFVSSDPSYRGEGRIDQLMANILNDCKENKVLFSYLAPFSYPFYRRYGYELIFERIAYDVPSHEWPDSRRVPGKIRRQTWEQSKDVIKEVYEASNRNKHGGLQREDWWYEYKFHIQRPYYFAVYYNESDEAEGYLIYQILNGKFHCAEWEVLSGNAYHALNRYIATHRDSVSEIRYEQGYNKNSSFFLQEKPLANATIRPEMMVRIVDIEAFLTVYPFDNLQAAFAIQILEDTYAPWNEGIFEIHSKGTVSKVAKTKLPTLTISVQRFTQLFLGYQKLRELMFFNCVTVDKEIVSIVEAILPTDIPVLEDYF